MNNRCPIISSDDLKASKHFLKKRIEEKEIELTVKKEELTETPTKYIVHELIKKDVEGLSSEIRSMKELVNKLEKYEN